MHPANTSTVMTAHVRDLQRAMHPERSSKRPRLPRFARARRTR
jgi:hypothetical protein